MVQAGGAPFKGAEGLQKGLSQIWEGIILGIYPPTFIDR